MRKQAFSQTLKTGHPEGMLSHKIFKRLSELSLYFFQKWAFIGCLDTLLAKTLRGRHVAFGILLMYFCFSLLRLQFQPSLCCFLPFLLSYVAVSRPCCLLKSIKASEEEQSLKERVPGHCQLQNIATIIVKSVGKVAFLPLFSPTPSPMLSKMLMFVRVIILFCFLE